MTLTAISWSGGGYDLHLLIGETGAALDSRLQFSRKVGAAAETHHTGNAPPAGVTVTFDAEFKPLGAQPAGKRSGHGVEVETATGIVKVAAALPARRLHNFLIRARVADADNSLDIRIRVHIHESIRKIWLTPRKLIVHAGTTNQQFTVLAEFDDGTNGDITGRTGLHYGAHNPLVVFADLLTGKMTHVSNGATQVSIELGPAPVPADLKDTADVITQPSLATERRIERVRGRGAVDFAKKVNILFLPDGFKAGEKAQFDGIVDRIVNGLQTDIFAYPYRLLKDSINYWRLAGADFPASEEENISVLSEAEIVGRRSMQAKRLPFPTDPGARTRWKVEHLVFKVGLPVPADRNRNRLAKLADWAVLYDGVIRARISNADFLAWRRLHTRKLLNDRSTALGFGIDDRPRADLDFDRVLSFDTRRVLEADFVAMVAKLRTGAAPGAGVVGTTWTAGKDQGLVCLIGRSRRNAGSRGAARFSSSLAEDSEQPVRAAAAPARGLDLVKMDLSRGGRALPLHPAIPITVAHECSHAFGLKDEYGGGLHYPAHRHAGIASNGNVQPATEVQAQPPQAAGIDGSRIKWNWPRLVAAGRLTGVPQAAGANFNVDLEAGHRAAFAVDDIVRLRKKDFIVVPPLGAFSGRFKIVALPAATPDRVVLAPEPGTVIVAADFGAGSTLVKPRTAFAVAGVGDDLPIIAPTVRNHIEAQDLPLNRTAAACAAAAVSTGEMTPVNRPAGLAPRRPRSKANIVGLYDGGDNFDCGVFHPAGICMMRTLARATARSARFCHVCRYLIVDRVDVTKHTDLDAVYEQYEYPEP